MKPTFIIRRNDILMLLDSPEAKGVSSIINALDRNGKRDSELWGHVSYTVTPDGTSMMHLPMNSHNLKQVVESGADANANDAETLKRVSFFSGVSEPSSFSSSLPLMQFQKEGAEWIKGHNERCILAFDAGLGKTLTSLSVLNENGSNLFPAIVLAPAHIKLNWENEWKKWGGNPNDIAVLFGRSPDSYTIAGKKVVVLNHHILAGWIEELVKINPKIILIDEAHNFVQSNTKTYKYVETLSRACGNRVLELTATPLVNDLGDMWGLCNLINPDILGAKGVFTDTFLPEEKAKQKMFASRWRGGFNKGAWRDVAMARLPKDLKEHRIEQLKDALTDNVILRKRKSEVIEQLPNITETNIRLDIPKDTDEGVRFWDVERQCESDIQEGMNDVLASDKLLAAFGKAKRNAAFAKIPYAEEWIRNFLDETEDTEKLVVAGWSVEPLERLHSIFKSQSILVNGEIDAKKKQKCGQEFMDNPKKRVLFGNYKSIGTGIDTLVAARTMMIFELPMTSVDLEQVKGRIDRISQKSKALSYYFMTIRDSIEEKRGWKIINRKSDISKKLGL